MQNVKSIFSCKRVISLLLVIFILSVSFISCEKSSLKVEQNDILAKVANGDFPISFSVVEMDQIILKEFGNIENLGSTEKLRLICDLLFKISRNNSIDLRTDIYILQSIVFLGGFQYDYDQVHQVGLPTTYVQADTEVYPENYLSEIACISRVLKNSEEVAFADDYEFYFSCPEDEFIKARARARLFSNGSYSVDANIICKD